MVFLLFGNNGWIGSKVVKMLEEKQIPYVSSTNRVDNIEAVICDLETYKPTNVLCLVGRTHGVHNGVNIPTIDYLEKKGKLVENLRDNLFGPVSLALLCKERDIHLTYLGTGCIFNYADDKTVFTEDDEPNFFGSSYSVVKGFTDRFMHMFDNVLNVRIRMPISEDNSSRNFINKIVSYSKICSVKNSMTVLEDLLPIMIDMSINKTTGTINLVNQGTIDHQEILNMYKEIVDPTFTYQLFSYEEQMQVLASERSNNELSTTKIENLGYKVPHIKTSVRNILERMLSFSGGF